MEQPTERKEDMNYFLVRQAQNGNLDAFVQLMEQSKQSLYKVVKSYLKREEDVADAMQETVLSAYENLPNLREASYFKTWLTRILINRCKDILRQNQRVLPMEEIDSGTCPSPEQDRGFYELLESLPEDYRTLFLLYYGEGFNTREIAELLDMNENTVKSRLQRGRTKLQEAL